MYLEYNYKFECDDKIAPYIVMLNNKGYGEYASLVGSIMDRLKPDPNKELGEIMGLSVQSINKWRHGHNLPDIENLSFLSRIFGIKVDDFLIPLVVKPQIEVKYEFLTEVEGFSASAIRRLWAYFIRHKAKCIF